MDTTTGAKFTPISQSDRLFWVDFLKAISMMAVVSYHSLFLPTSAYAEIAPGVEVLFAPLRFCVPVLLSLSFFLLARSLERYPEKSRWELCRKRLFRLLIPTLFWFSIAAGLRYFGQPAERGELGLILLQGKVFPGAYYLLVMLQLIPLAIWCDRLLQSTRITILSFGLQSLAFVAIYLSLSQRINPQFAAFLEIPARSCLIYWFAYLPFGIYIQRNWQNIQALSAKIHPRLKALLLILVSGSFFIEFHAIYDFTNGDTAPFEYAMLSCLASAGLLILCFANLEADRLPNLIIAIVKLISKYSLGIFCVNGILSLIFLKIGSQIFTNIQLNWEFIIILKLMGWVGLLTLSVFLSQLLDRLGLGNCVR
ncbi:MAG: acyltransferase [Desertifilum sp. SIO1I2]|nr:acyltransferase [Desertifilum sp. SIO1I2]